MICLRLIGAALIAAFAAAPLGAQQAQDGASSGATLPPAGQIAPAGDAPAEPQRPSGPVGMRIDSSGAIAPSLPAPPAATGDQPAAASDQPKDDDQIAAALDYAAWSRTAQRAEEVLADPNTTDATLETIRSGLVDWRAQLLSAQSANSARIDTLRTQIAALGAAPADGATEPDEIAARRRELNDQLVTLQAPGITAEEGYTRADGLIREIDRVLRERQTSALLQLWPSPLNPQNWPSAISALNEVATTLWNEAQLRWKRPSTRATLTGNLPVILLSLGLGLALVLRGRPLMERISLRLQDGASQGGRRLWAFFVSLGQFAIPTVGALAFSTAIKLTALPGTLGQLLLQVIPVAAFVIFSANWLGGRMFPKGNGPDPILHLPQERRAEGRLLATLTGILMALEGIRTLMMEQIGAGEAAIAVAKFPLIGLLGLLLWRLGRLLRQHLRNEEAEDSAFGFRNRVVGLTGSALIGLGIAGPLLAAVGYVAAGSVLVYSAATSMALMSLIFILQRVVGQVYALVTGGDESAQDALIPVLIGFVLVLVALPLFALIWGARLADLSEMWTKFADGFQMGETRISPADFLFFAVIFGVGYTITRFVQGALNTTILPRTSLDQGGQNAVNSGVGYVGIFLSGLIAVNSTGIDLSGLAIVAGALSVGIGFGLQNIVSNFVSGIILLIERPVSDGDWIEVGTTSGIVKSISVRSTRIQTFDRSDVIVPNSDLVQQRVTNWTRFSPIGRLVLQVNVGIGADTARVEAILKEVAEAQPLALLKPPPQILLMGFGNNMLNYEVRVLLRDVNFSPNVRTEMNREIVRRFIEARILLVPGTPEMIVHQGRPWDAPAPPAPGAESVPPGGGGES